MPAMTAATRPHLLSLEEWDALGEDSSSHAELQEGGIVSPKPIFGHQRAALRIGAALDAAATEEFDVAPGLDVVIEARTPATVRAPDVVVLRAGTRNPIPAEKVALAVEVLSPGTRRTDLVMKRHEYAEAGIPQYWIVDLDGGEVRLDALTLVDNAYESASYTGVFETTVPFPVRLDLASLR